MYTFFLCRRWLEVFYISLPSVLTNLDSHWWMKTPRWQLDGKFQRIFKMDEVKHNQIDSLICQVWSWWCRCWELLRTFLKEKWPDAKFLSSLPAFTLNMLTDRKTVLLTWHRHDKKIPEFLQSYQQVFNQVIGTDGLEIEMKDKRFVEDLSEICFTVYDFPNFCHSAAGKYKKN